jgi:lipopolysaccharide biosynthesis glycosyltransferase
MELNFVYCFDDNFNLQGLTSIKSLLDKITKKANIFIIHKNIQSFYELSKTIEGHENLLNLRMYQFDSSQISLPPINSHVSEATYYRLFISKYLPKDIKFLTYLDADIICINDPTPELIATFSLIESENTVIAAKVESKRENNNIFFERLNLKNDEQFNAGVLVIDFSKWVNQNIESYLFNILNQRYDDIFDYDQEILNIYFDGRFTNLDINLNFQAIGGQDDELFNHIENNVLFLHYLGKGKPWSVENFIFSTSEFYQREFKKLGFGKPHLIFPRNISNIKKIINILFSKEFRNFDKRFVFVKYSFISFFKKLNKH